MKDKAKEITLPESLLVIGGFETFRRENDDTTRNKFGAFQNWTALQSITVPKNVRTINPYAFAGCESLSSITILNPDCDIRGTSTTICNKYYEGCDDSGTFTGTIYGYSGSTAEAYANKYGYHFEALGSAPRRTPSISTATAL